VVLNARDAADRGAEVRTRCEVLSLARVEGAWRIETSQGGFTARAVVNAAGPSVLDLLRRADLQPDCEMRLVRGSHIVVPKLFDHAFAYFFQLPDGRIFFAIPYEEEFTLIGTTDCDHQGGLDQIEASAEEVSYLCEGASQFFARPVMPADVVWSWAGVRPLVADHSGKPDAASRGYRLDLSAPEEGAPLLTVYGGKITTYRHLAEAAMVQLATRLPELGGPGWTGTAALPGGNFGMDGLTALTADLARDYPFLDPFTARRLARSYGTLVWEMLGKARTESDCGASFGHGLTTRELDWMRSREWATCAEDVLWRRSKLGLRLSAAEAAAVANWFDQQPHSASAAATA
jgi:glycerol-3-phosphate dehydrogenase